MSSACSQAVELPEIVAAIMEQLCDNRTLFAALQVNRLWAEEATTVLWQNYPSISALIQIHDAERLQYYANKVSHWEIADYEDGPELHRKLQLLRFPRLRQISVRSSYFLDGKKFLRYLQPNLRRLLFVGFCISDYHLRCIRAHFPTLESLTLQTLHSCGNDSTAHELLQFLHDMPSLTRLCLFLERTISDEVFIHLASRLNLTALDSRQMLTLNLIEMMQEVVEQPFSRLLSLTCCSHSKAFSQLSRHLLKVEKLHLHLMDSARETIFDVCSFTSLLILELDYCQCPYFDTSTHFPANGFLALAKRCPHLQQLAVKRYPMSIGNDGVGDINDDALQEFVSLLPHLTHLRLRIVTNLAHRALRILGEGCTMLQECWLIGKSLQLGPLGSSGPVLFPKLERLQLWGTQRDLPATTAAEILHHHAPRMKKVWIENPWSINTEIHERMQELARRDEAQSRVSDEH
ncbi:hypothetical protein BDR22DRAFT_860017 [Usnea florida]